MRWEDPQASYGPYFSMRLEVTECNDRLTVCIILASVLDSRLYGGKGGSRKASQEAIKRGNGDWSTKPMKNGGIRDTF